MACQIVEKVLGAAILLFLLSKIQQQGSMRYCDCRRSHYGFVIFDSVCDQYGRTSISSSYLNREYFVGIADCVGQGIFVKFLYKGPGCVEKKMLQLAPVGDIAGIDISLTPSNQVHFEFFGPQQELQPQAA